jgi:uncharacterized protein YndB with AHSA1/START domain
MATHTHAGKAEMLIRRPIAEVFHAFVEPAVLTRFWLDSASGPLAKGARVQWHFMVPGAVETTTVTAFDEPRRIAFDWSDGVHVQLDFEDLGDGSTRASVDVSGFTGDEAVDGVVGATEGFAIVLCDLKTLLETGRSGGLVKDRAALIARSMPRGG